MRSRASLVILLLLCFAALAPATALAAPPPAPTITNQPNDPSNLDREFSFGFVRNEPGGTFQCAIDDPFAYAPCSSPYTYTGVALPDGPHTFYVRHLNDDLEPSAPATVTWTIKTTNPPAPTINGLLLDGQPFAYEYETNVESGTITLSFSMNEPGGEALCYFGPTSFEMTKPGNFSPCDTATSHSVPVPLEEGTFYFSVIQRDDAGNTSSGVSAFREVTIDRSAPEAPTIIQHPATNTTDEQATFAGIAYSAADRGPRYECRIDGQSWTNCTYNIGSFYLDAGLLAVGLHTFEVRVIDWAGNASQPASYSWEIVAAQVEEEIDDGTPPLPPLPPAAIPAPPVAVPPEAKPKLPDMNKCALRYARARVFVFSKRSKRRSDRIRLVIRYKTKRKARVRVGYEMIGRKGNLNLGYATKNFKRKGVFRLEFKVSKRYMKKIRAAKQFKAQLKIKGEPGYCARAYVRHITKPKTIEGQTVWFQRDSNFINVVLPPKKAPIKHG